ncbi:MAG TPA: integrase arm-type DNA-binding domain-containing protein [Pseudolabrys sp.]
MLTNAAAKAAQPQARAYKVFDAGGLFLFVAPSGLKAWRMKYRFGAREKLLTFGHFPEVSLVDARTMREAARAQLRAGADPAGPKHQGGDSFEAIARAWHGYKLESWSPAHAHDVLASLVRDVFPQLGRLPIGAIDPPTLLAALREVEARGCIETARRIRQRLSAIFGYAVAEGHLAGDPADKLGRAMRSARPPRPQPALVTIEDCRALLAACENSGARASTILASRFLALTAVRLDAVRGMRWGEIEDLDGVAPVWRVPPARMKLARAKKDDERFEHLVPLSPQAVSVLRQAAIMRRRAPNMHRGSANLQPDRPICKPDGLVFPGQGRASPLGEGAIGALYARAGFAGRHVPHGWRASFSTIMNEQLGDEWRGTIDRALAHSPKDKVEGAYNRAQQLGRRREVFAKWGALLADETTPNH